MKTYMLFLIVSILSITSLALAQIDVTLPDTSIDAGTTVMVSINVSDVTSYDITSFQFDLDFDSTVVKPVAVTIENTISAENGQVYFNLDNNGLLTAAVIVDGTLSGAGKLINIFFEAVGAPEDSTDLLFSYFEFDANTEIANTHNGSIKLNSNIIDVSFSANVSVAVEILVDDTLRALPYDAKWLKGSGHQINVPSPQDIGNGVQYLFENWSDGGAISHAVSTMKDTSFEVTFSTQYYLEIISDYGSPVGEGWYDAGSQASFSVGDLVTEGDTTRHNFVSWTGSGEGSYSGEEREMTVEMTNPITEQANWDDEYFLKVNAALGTPYGEGWYVKGSTAEFGIDSTDFQSETKRSYFVSWTGQGDGSYSGAGPQQSVVVNNPIVENANWNTEYYLQILTDPPDLIQIDGSGWYERGEVLTTIQAPDSVIQDTATYFFKEWIVAGCPVADNPLTITIDSAMVIQALYGLQINVIVTTSIGTGTKVVVDGMEHTAPFATKWLSEEQHLIAVEAVQNMTDQMRYAFNKWNNGGEREQVVNPAESIAYIAALDTQFYVKMISSPEGLIEIEGSGWYTVGEQVMLPGMSQVVKDGDQIYRFRMWKINGCELGQDQTEFNVNAAEIVEACFEKAYSICGKVKLQDEPLANVNMVLTGVEADTTQTDADGFYEFAALFSGNYTITPRMDGLRFEPEALNFQNIETNFMGQDFAAIDTATNVATDDANNPGKCRLDQNYPNPFNNSTIIEFNIPEKSQVSLKIFNILGQPVKTLVSGTEQTGICRIQWDGTNQYGEIVPSGVYFYKLKVNALVLSKKMILLE